MDSGFCVIEGCDQAVHVKSVGYCRKHYSAWNRHGDPLAWKRRTRPACSVEACGLKAAAKGLCDVHYRRLRRYGTPTPPERPTTCSVEGCERSVDALGMCDMHYRRQREGRDLLRCGWCDDPMPDAPVKGRRRYCSREHQQLAQRERARVNYRDDWLKKYGITVAGYDRMLAEQGGGCAICGSADPRGRARSPHFQIDHDHDTGNVRGLLCAPCNTGLGHFGDSIENLRSAIAYLQRAAVS